MHNAIAFNIVTYIHLQKVYCGDISATLVCFQRLMSWGEKAVVVKITYINMNISCRNDQIIRCTFEEFVKDFH